ncbi:MAG TPA: prolipoprotein diacylglyceryl transferase [Dehalococcoidia bacterium]|nr:prolipoprotein diacylglyceryl transferase [Chloroflexota bacterium]HCI86779.1 prolipoprotein diacylglyceryl transferase [Dehalococcoidia bacterium]|tara:strand:- start:6015 stop:6911 length:897 start_codon:yes stop_codon:yes gene_type:complete
MPIAAIEIPFNPNIVAAGGNFSLSWHGFLSFVGVAVAVWMVGRAAVRENLDQEMVYNTAIFGIVGGIIGARLVHVADNWGIYGDDPGRILAIWSGGIGLWGGILGGWIGGATYAWFAKAPIGRLMDIAAPAMFVGQTIGRIGDIINGEHWSRALDAGWGWYFTHPDSPARIGAERFFGDPERAVHPTVVYEIIWNMLGLYLITRLKGKLQPAGAIWMVYITWYSVGRFSIQYLRLDDVKFWGLQEAHLIAIGVLAFTIPYMIMKVRWANSDINVGSGDGDNRSVGRRKRDRQRQQAKG